MSAQGSLLGAWIELWRLECGEKALIKWTGQRGEASWCCGSRRRACRAHAAAGPPLATRSFLIASCRQGCPLSLPSMLHNLCYTAGLQWARDSRGHGTYKSRTKRAGQAPVQHHEGKRLFTNHNITKQRWWVLRIAAYHSACLRRSGPAMCSRACGLPAALPHQPVQLSWLRHSASSSTSAGVVALRAVTPLMHSAGSWPSAEAHSSGQSALELSSAVSQAVAFTAAKSTVSQPTMLQSRVEGTATTVRTRCEAAWGQ